MSPIQSTNRPLPGKTRTRGPVDSHLCRISVAKHRIKILDENTQKVNSASYREGLKTTEFEKVEMEKMQSQKIIEPAQTEWAAPIVFGP